MVVTAAPSAQRLSKAATTMKAVADTVAAKRAAPTGCPPYHHPSRIQTRVYQDSPSILSNNWQRRWVLTTASRNGLWETPVSTQGMGNELGQTTEATIIVLADGIPEDSARLHRCRHFYDIVHDPFTARI
jgi:hypothetical protein